MPRIFFFSPVRFISASCALCVCVCAWSPMLWICCRNDHVLPHLHMFPQEGELLPEYNSGNPKYQYHSGREAIARIVLVQTVRNGMILPYEFVPMQR